MSGTYPDEVVYKGKRYRYSARAYADNVVQGRQAKKQLGELAKRERKRGSLTRLVKREGRTHTVYYLYVHCPQKK